MLSFIPTAIRQLVVAGTSNRRADEARHIQLTNSAALVCVVLGWPYVACFAATGHVALAAVTLCAGVIALTPISLNRRGRHKTAVIAWFVIMNAGVALTLVFAGGATQVHYYGMSICAVVWLALPAGGVALPLVLVAIEMMLFAATEWLAPTTGVVVVSPIMTKILHVGSVVGSFSVLTFCLFVFARVAHTAEAELLLLASTDSLTGLSNRREFMRHGRAELARSTRHGHPMAMLLLDIDHFKRVNDTHGHHVGDDVIKLVATESVQQLRAHDVVARIGGEEFAIVLPQTDRRGAMIAAERLRSRIANSFVLVNHERVAVTVSVGVTIASRSDTTPEQVMERADSALYKAKRSGRDRVVFGAHFGITEMVSGLRRLAA